MSTEADILKEFLVSLGFSIDKSSERKFSDSLAAATVKAVALGAAVASTASIVVAGVAKIADSLEQLYFVSERTKASADNILAFGFSASQMGSSVDGAVNSLENMARLLRNSPGGEGLLGNIGVRTRDANGQLRDSVEMLGDLGKKFAAMPYYKANAYAQALGIDEKTLMALRQGVGQFSDDYKRMLQAAGLDAQTAAKGSHDFMVELRGLGAAATILVQKIASTMVGRLGESIRRLRETFVSNFARITDVVVRVAGVLFRITEAISLLALRGVHAISSVIDWFNGLSTGAQTVIKWLGAILVAWKVLNAGFLSSPIGRIVALATALALLWDDYQVWKEGGKSLIDWKAWAPGIEAAIAGIEKLAGWIHKGLEFAGDWRPALEILLAYVATSWVFGMLGAVAKVVAGYAAAAATAAASFATVLNLGLLAIAGAAGYAAGSWFWKKFLEGTDTGDVLGRNLAKVMAFFGNKEAKAALESEKRTSTAAPAGPNAVDGVTPLKPPAPKPATPVHTPAGQNPPVTEGVMRIPAPVPTAPTAPSAQTWGNARGLRNNNPGNIEYGKFARQQGATGVEDQGRFAVFSNAQAGLDALATLLRGYAARGIDSVRKIIEKYAPAKDGNNTKAYVENVSKRLGVSPDQKLDFKNPDQLRGVMDAVVRVENGRNPYRSEMLDKAATGSGSGRAVEVKQTTQITVNGAEDPRATAREVRGAQEQVNEQLTRNMRGAVLQ